MQRIVSWTRYLVLMGVIGSMMVAASLFIAALFHSFEIVYRVFTSLGQDDVRNAIVIDAISHADDFLIATALYMISTGLYALFIGKLELPAWLQISSLDDLKERLIGVIVVVMGVDFVGAVSEWDNQRELIVLGASVGMVIVSLAVFSWVSHRNKSSGH